MFCVLIYVNVYHVNECMCDVCMMMGICIYRCLLLVNLLPYSWLLCFQTRATEKQN